MKPTAWTTVYVLTLLTVALVGTSLTAAGSGFREWAVVGAAAALMTAGAATAIVIGNLRGHGNVPRHS